MRSAPVSRDDYDAAVVGGGPAGATAAAELARGGARVLLIERGARVKPCGGAIPTRLIRDFAVPPALLVARARSARIVAPSGTETGMVIGEGFVGMVDREAFDPWLRERASAAGATLLPATFLGASRRGDGALDVAFAGREGRRTVRARLLVGADGANSAVRRAMFGPDARPPYVFAYHEIVRAPDEGFDGERCDVHYDGRASPDFYGWVFPHGSRVSVGTGSATKGFDLREAVRHLRRAAGLSGAETIRREGAPLPLKPLGRWDDGRNTVLIGDAAGVVAPASGEGIYYAMLTGRLAAESGAAFLAGGEARALKQVRHRFMKEHGRVFLALGLMQRFWYSSDKRRERFAALCADPDIQRIVWDSYLEKRMTRADPMAYLRIFAKDLGHVLRLGLG